MIDGEGEPFGGLFIGDTGLDDTLALAPKPPTLLPPPGSVTNAFGDGDACIESMPESPACSGSINNELRRLISVIDV